MSLPPPPAGYVPPTVNNPTPDIFLARAQAFGLKTAAKPAAAPAPAPAAALPVMADADAPSALPGGDDGGLSGGVGGLSIAAEAQPPALPPLPPGAATLPPLPPGAATLPPLPPGANVLPPLPPGANTGAPAMPPPPAGFTAAPAATSAGGPKKAVAGGAGVDAKVAAATAAASMGPKLARKPDIDTLPKKPTPAVAIPKDATPHERMTALGDAAFAAEMGAVFDKIEADAKASDAKAGRSGNCGVCNKALRTNPPVQIVEAGDESYHEQCFRCFGCNKKLSGEVLTIAGKFYHTPCLVCRHCKCSLVGADFHVSPVNEQLYCKLHARVPVGGNTCAGCQKSIPGTETAVNAGDKTYHPACFVCAYCNESLSGKQCFIKDGDAYCENDYKQLFGVRCGGCKELILGGQCLTVGEKKIRFHPPCFACANADCKVPLKGLPFFFKADNVFCNKHK